jgi:hypothetical protein
MDAVARPHGVVRFQGRAERSDALPPEARVQALEGSDGVRAEIGVREIGPAVRTGAPCA